MLHERDQNRAELPNRQGCQQCHSLLQGADCQEEIGLTVMVDKFLELFAKEKPRKLQ
jgi:hypothetical protein